MTLVSLLYVPFVKCQGHFCKTNHDLNNLSSFVFDSDVVSQWCCRRLLGCNGWRLRQKERVLNMLGSAFVYTKKQCWEDRPCENTALKNG